MTDRLLCDNEDHGPRPAYAAVTWPDGRFRGSRACRSCLRQLVALYVTGTFPDERHPALILPLDAVAPGGGVSADG